MVVYNYTKIKRREKRVYSLFNTTISQTGLLTSTLQICGVLLFIFNFLGILFCVTTGWWLYNPLTITQATLWFYLIVIGIPIGLGIWLNTAKIQNYKIIEYLIIYFKPKKPVDHNGKIIKITEYDINTHVEKF